MYFNESRMSGTRKKCGGKEGAGKANRYRLQKQIQNLLVLRCLARHSQNSTTKFVEHCVVSIFASVFLTHQTPFFFLFPVLIDRAEASKTVYTLASGPNK